MNFIGNYKKANFIPFFLAGDVKEPAKRTNIIHIPDEDDYPEDCFVNFDFRLIDLFKRMADDRHKSS